MGRSFFAGLSAIGVGLLMWGNAQAADAWAAPAPLRDTSDTPMARAANETPSLTRFLDGEGRLALPAGFSGSLDPSGFALVSKPGEPPRFAAKNAVDDPERWDPQFGQAIGCDGEVSAMAALPDGRIALAGAFLICGNVTVNRVALWNPGAGTFAALGAVPAFGIDDLLTALAVAGTDIYVGGSFTVAGGVVANNVARFNTATQVWSALGSAGANGINGVVGDLALSGSDLYVGGGFTQAGGATANRVARFNASSQAWSALGAGSENGVNNFVEALAVVGTEVYVGGRFTQAGGAVANRVARFSTDAQTWSSLGSGAANGVNGIAVAAIASAGSDVYVGGFFSQAGGATANNIARFNAVTQAWSPLGTGAANGVNNSVVALAIAGSDVVVGGSFTLAGGAAANRVARFNTGAQSWSSLGTGAANGSTGTVVALAIAGSDLYVGGGFSQAGGSTANNVARFNTSTQNWSVLGAGATNGLSGGGSFPRALALAIAGSDVYVGGVFTEAGGATANRVARFNTSTQTWSSLGVGAANGVSGLVNAIAVVGTDVYVGGEFTLAGGATANRVARFNTTTQTWSTLGSGAANGVNNGVTAFAISGSDVYVAGFFTQAGGATANRVARFNTGTQTWFSLGTGAANGVSGSANAVAISGSDVYVGGNFFQAGGATANRVARFNTGAQAWFPLGTGAANGVNGAVAALAITGSDVYVGGDFRQAGGAAAEGVARFNASSQTWSSLGSGAANGVRNCDFATCVLALTISGSDVYVGGNFTVAGGATANRVARFNTNSQAWSSLGTGSANGTGGEFPSVDEIAVVGRDVYLGGEFTRAGPNFSFRIGRYDIRLGTTTSLQSSPAANAVVNTPVTFTASVATAGFPGQPGTVVFLDDGVAIPGCASQALVGGLDVRTASCTTTNLRVGGRSVVARYLGDAFNFIGTSDALAIDVASPTFAFAPSSLPSGIFGSAGYSSGAVSVSISDGSGLVAPVTFQVVNAAQLPPGLTASAQPNGLVITGTPTQAGSFTFTVRAGDSSSAAVGGPFSSDRQYTIVIARAAQTIGAITRVDAVPLDNGVAFADGNFAVQASASSGLPVSIDSTTPTVCQVGAPGFTVQPLQIGTCTLRARQIGNPNFEPAPEVLRTFQVKATADVAVSSTPNPSVWSIATGQEAAVLTATVESPAGTTPTGSVRFQRAGGTIAGCAAQPLSGSGSVASATCTTSALSRGPNAITAVYNGDALHVQTTSNAHTHQLNVGTSAGIATITPSPCVVGEACTVGVAVISANGTPTGSVQVGSSTGGSCTITLSAGGGSCALTATAAGTGTVSATYLASPPWLASPATTQSHPFVATVDQLFVDGFEPPVAGQAR
jgi:hypothetical protein